MDVGQIYRGGAEGEIRQWAIGKRDDHGYLVARVIGMDGDCSIPKHRFRTRCSDDDFLI